MLCRAFFIILFFSSLLIGRDQEYYRKHFNIDFNNSKIYKDIKIPYGDNQIFIEDNLYYIIFAKYNFDVFIVCINKTFDKYTVLIGDFIPGENSFDLVLSANEIKNIDRFLNFFEIEDPTKDNLLKYKFKKNKKRKQKGLVIIY